jgi:hypothetical protein
MPRLLSVVPLLGVLSGCGGSDSDPLTRMEQYSAMYADLGLQADTKHVDSLDGAFGYNGYGYVDFTEVGDVGNIATYAVDVTAEFNAGGPDFMSGTLSDFVPVNGDGTVRDTETYEGFLRMSRAQMSGVSVSGNVTGMLRYREDGEGGTNLVFGGGTNYSATLYDSTRGDPARYLFGGIDGCFNCSPDDEGEPFSGPFIAER